MKSGFQKEIIKKRIIEVKALMGKKLKLNILFFFAVFLFIAGHGIYLNTPWVNLEYSFAEATRTILNPDYTIGLKHYWEIEANPLGYSLIAAVVASFLNVSFWSVRIPSLFGGIVILFAGWVFYRSKNFKNDSLFFLWVAAITINPLVWIYSGRAVADILPVGFIVLSFLLCYCAKGRLWMHFIAGLCFSVASLVKFNSILLGLGFVYIIFTDEHGKIRWSREKGLGFLFYSLLPLCILGMYFLVIYNQFEILCIPEKFKTTHFEGHVKNFALNVGLYSSYLAITLALLSFLSVICLLKTWSRKAFFILIFISVILGTVFWKIQSDPNAFTGEMGFGGFYDKLMSNKVASLIRVCSLLLAFFLFVQLMDSAFRERNRIALFLVCTLFPFLIISSFSRPAQRYLLFCLPFLTFYVIVVLGAGMPRLVRWLGWPSVIIFIAITFLSIFYQIGQGRASENMAQWIILNGYLKDTEPGSIMPHAGLHFMQDIGGSKKYIVIEEPQPQNFLHRENVMVFGKGVKTYYFTEQTPSRLSK